MGPRVEERAMARTTGVTRREFLALATACGALGAAPARTFAQGQMPQRMIPRSGEALPVIGLGSSKVVSEIATKGTDPVGDVLRALVANGGRLVDTWPRNADNDSGFGRVINAPDLRDKLFVTTKIDQKGKEAGIAQFRQTQREYGRDTLDLVQIFSLTDLDVHWPSLRAWQDAGKARYIGVTVAEYELYPQLEDFLRRETPDFVQMNYSITERRAEERLLPLAVDRGAAVLINRPFMNGTYFQRLQGTPLPEWAGEVGCDTWAQFSLKYILANPDVTCVLTETSNPRHMADNAQTAYGMMPDSTARARMRAFIDQI
jgi:diketogulonate reductase-like aldo/keto reductase